MGRGGGMERRKEREREGDREREIEIDRERGGGLTTHRYQHNPEPSAWHISHMDPSAEKKCTIYKRTTPQTYMSCE